MRQNLFVKLMLGFTIVIVACLLIVVVSVRVTTRNQYTRLINRNDLAMARELSMLMSGYYQANGGWSGVQALFDEPAAAVSPGPMSRMGKMGSDRMMMNAPEIMFLRMFAYRTRILLLDSDGAVIADSRRKLLLNSLPLKAWKTGAEVTMGNDTVGYLFVGSMIDSELNELNAGFLRAVNLSVLFSALAGLLAALAVSLFFFRKITSPIRELSTASGRIAGGDFSVRIDPRGDDELTDLSHSFNSMVNALARGEEWKKQMISDAAHELRTPVSLIKANLELMLEGVYKLDRKQLENIHRETEKMADLIRELQEFSHMESGSLILKHEPVFLRDILGRVCDLFAPRAAEKNIELIIDPSDDSPAIYGDYQKLNQVFSNLLTNALTYTPSGGTVRLNWQRRKDQVLVSVRDNGPGIDPVLLESVFERFFRVDQSRTRGAGDHGDSGRGLGLAICRSIVTAHKGKIWAESDGESGTVIYVLLPAAEAGGAG